MEHCEDGGSEQPGSSDIGQSLALRTMEIIEPVVLRIVPRQFKPMFIWILQEVMGQVVKVLLPELVREELQKREERGLIGRTRNDMPNVMTFKLKFSDKVSDTVTGGMLEGVKDKCLMLTLLGSNEDVVTSGEASSAEVEILLLDTGNINEDNMTHEIFARSIIPAGDKEKPHFTKRVYISLKNGVGNLSGLKLGKERWITSCNCRLGARIAQNLGGITVQEAWTSPFKVIDYRDALKKKHNPPSLNSEVWRLKEIYKGGNPCKRLEEKNIQNLQDFRFWLNVKPEELKKILLGNSRSSRKWNTTVEHARTCIIDDKRMYSHEFSTEPQMRVVYDVVGDPRGEIIESRFVPFDHMSADRKDRARELLASVLEPSAFPRRYNNFFEDEAALLQQFPIRSSVIDAFSNSPIQQLSDGNNNPTFSEIIHEYQPYSSPSIIPTGFWEFEHHSCSLGSVFGPHFDAGIAGLSPFGPCSAIQSNAALYSDVATAGGEDPLLDRSADEVKMKLKVHVCMMRFVVRIVEDVDGPRRKKQRVGAAA